MISNVTLYPFDPARDEYSAYECSSEQKPQGLRRQTSSRQVYGQICFEAPWVSVPDALTGSRHISLEELEMEMERDARRKEH